MRKYLKDERGVVVVGYGLFILFLAIATVIGGTAYNHKVAAEQHSLNQ